MKLVLKKIQSKNITKHVAIAEELIKACNVYDPDPNPNPIIIGEDITDTVIKKKCCWFKFLL